MNRIFQTLRSVKSILLVGLIIGSVASIGLVPTGTASALTGSDFNAGHIIDDFIFTNSAAMSATDIQNFLNAKLPTCDTNGSTSKSYYYNSSTGEINRSSSGSFVTTTRLIYGQRYAAWNNAHPPSANYIANESIGPYVCLKNYVENPTTGQNNLQNPNTAVSGGQSAAQIIYNVAQAYNINPQVILTTLQKEQGVVTDDWPWTNEYIHAMGYNCTDSAPCSGFSGFYQQVNAAAKQFRKYLTNPNSYNYVVGSQSVPYSPSCGGPAITIQNQATAALYDYTPYQPEPSVLNATNPIGSPSGPGRIVGGGCDAYGNRNFWWYFNTWFGSTLNPYFGAAYDSQSPYPILDSGTSRTVYFRFKNAGNSFWKDDLSTFPGYLPIHIATTSPINRASAFRASDWINYARPTGTLAAVYDADGTLNASATSQHTVQPGQIGEFQFSIYANPNMPGGIYREYFQPIIEGAPGYSWNMGAGVYLDIGVNIPSYKASYYSQSAYPTLAPGGSTTSSFKFKNIGGSPWYDDTSTWQGKQPVHLATSWPINRSSIFGSSWTNTSRPAMNLANVYESDGVTPAANRHVVQPGQIGEYDFTVSAPANATPGFYQEHFEPIVEGAPGYSWNMGTDVWLGITIN